jgi:hypothetical protein
LIRWSRETFIFAAELQSFTSLKLAQGSRLMAQVGLRFKAQVGSRLKLAQGSRLKAQGPKQHGN